MQQLKEIPSHIFKKIQAGIPPEEGANLFGLPLGVEDASLCILGVPWEATASYGRGTSEAPQRIVPASYQLDLFDSHFGEFYRYGIFYEEANQKISSLNQKALQFVNSLRAGGEKLQDDEAAQMKVKVNQFSAQVNEMVYEKAKQRLAEGKWVGLLGGDHSSPFGLIEALSEHTSFGILHIDAHHDLRNAYEGYTFSHASIMYNVMATIPQINKLVQVGIRDYSSQERDLVCGSWKEKIKVFYDHEISEQLARGKTFSTLTDEIIQSLPEKIYVSFDIDGLEPSLCPATGTPVPGGLSYHQAVLLLKTLATSGKDIIGFDLCEVGVPKAGEWDLNVGARILYKLCGMLLSSKNQK